ncbi:hypothetical protein [Microbulbifer sp. THAF38]|uniref:hypothetical protein n=1 Tax=Microbulbifer sp. THAF38 TaxID=2587856 RepID=UPI00126943B9|nr:hypothetical protein [Microbulbifer sp. THAF38]QFT53208.1 hypothetical protein FIU95_01260 [Microbulbifer sp. THAF38]
MSYIVVFTGEIRTHFERRKAIAALGGEFGLSFSQIKALMASSRSQLKKTVDRAEASRFIQKLWNAGWHSRLYLDSELIHCSKTSVENGGSPLPVVMDKLHCGDPQLLLCAPRNWVPCDNLNPNAEIQVGNTDLNRYLIVLAQKRSELPVTLSLTDYADAQMQQCLAKVSDGQLVSGPKVLEREWQTGLLYEMCANVGNDSVQYMVAFFQGKMSFYTLFLWTSLQSFAQAKVEFIQIVATFQAPEEGVTTTENKGSAVIAV